MTGLRCRSPLRRLVWRMLTSRHDSQLPSPTGLAPCCASRRVPPLVVPPQRFAKDECLTRWLIRKPWQNFTTFEQPFHVGPPHCSVPVAWRREVTSTSLLASSDAWPRSSRPTVLFPGGSGRNQDCYNGRHDRVRQNLPAICRPLEP